MTARFVEQGGLATAPGPLDCTGTRMFGFWARADRDSLASLCDAVFAGPSDDRVVVRPLLPWVLITFVRIERIVSRPFAEVGWLSEREVVIWVPALVFRPPAGLPRRLRRWWLVPRHVPAAMVPCMWLDNPISIASGREVYGYPKAWGCMASDPPDAIGDPPAGAPPAGDELPPAPRRLSLDAFGVERYRDPPPPPGGPGDAERQPACRPLLELERVDGEPAGAEEREGFGELLRECGRELAGSAGGDRSGSALRLPGGDRDEPAWESPGARGARALERRGRGVRASVVDAALDGAELSQMFLKQFRSAADGRRASSQEIVRAPASRIEGFRWRRLPPYRLAVHHLDSHPVVERASSDAPGALRLGLEPEQRIDVAFAARFDFRVELGEVLWRAD